MVVHLSINSQNAQGYNVTERMTFTSLEKAKRFLEGAGYVRDPSVKAPFIYRAEVDGMKRVATLTQQV